MLALRHQLLAATRRAVTSRRTMATSRTKTAVSGELEGQSNGLDDPTTRAKKTDAAPSLGVNAKRLAAAASIKDRGIALLRNPQINKVFVIDVL